mmetsp:Transcript_78913/g.228097  ORF Transcript_78913/g.228097 Transcript_78913/m.228097 type:complete len:260 (-) Transcript_78913:68-847(-)
MTEVAFFLDDQTSNDFAELSTLLSDDLVSSSTPCDFQHTVPLADETRHFESLPEFNLFCPTDKKSDDSVTRKGTVGVPDCESQCTGQGRQPACVSPTPSTSLLEQKEATFLPSFPDVNIPQNCGDSTKVIPTLKSNTRKRKNEEIEKQEPEAVLCKLNQKDRRREKNREHAKKSRSKKKDLTKHLEESVLLLKEENQKLTEFLSRKLQTPLGDTKKMVQDRIVTPTDRFIAGLKQPSNRILSNSAIAFLKSFSSECSKR